MTSQQNKQKLTWLLLLQGWTMLWVIIGHAPMKITQDSSAIDFFINDIANGLFIFAYSFHMPLFIMISGYLFYMTRIKKRWKYPDMIHEKWIRLGIPYIVFITFAILLKYFAQNDSFRPLDISPTGILMNYIDPFNGALQEMWFIAVIATYFILYPIYPILLKNYTNSIIAVILALCMFYIPMNLIPSIFAIDRSLHFFIYFLLGTIICRYQLGKYIERWITILSCIILYIIAFFIDNSLLLALSASIGFWGFAICMDRSLSNNLFHSFRNYTYQIFLIGIFIQIFIKILYHFIPKFTGSYLVCWVICILSGIYIPIFISKIANRYQTNWIRKCIGL